MCIYYFLLCIIVILSLSSHAAPVSCAVWFAETSGTVKIGRLGSSSDAMPVHAVLMPNFAKKKAKEAVIQPGMCLVVQKLRISCV